MNPVSLAALARRFPPDFVFGVATSSYQIEGGVSADGRAPSVWDTFCRRPGVIADGSNGDVACDHYHRLDEDLDLIASLGVDGYRFSISWSRVQPLGQGPWNEAGLHFYERLVDGLARRGLRAYATLDHWDLPQALQDQGGWAARETVHRFVDYARGMQSRLGDRVAVITTHNEPWVVSVLGHEQGVFAPGLRDRRMALQVAHHLLLSHGLAVQAMRADGARAELGIVLNLAPHHAASAGDADRAAMRWAESLASRWYTDPLLRGHYPTDVLDALGADAPVVEAGDMATIATACDYMGVNYYTRSVISADGRPYDPRAQGLPVTDMDWEIYPQGLTELLCQLARDYPGLPKLYITENGAAFDDRVQPDGSVNDVERVRYLEQHLAALADALDAGVPVGAYMAWSLMDNFEWSSGYAKRFGLVHVDYATQRRTPKASALWYRDFLRARQRP